jgi:hypothetical protein
VQALNDGNEGMTCPDTVIMNACAQAGVPLAHVLPAVDAHDASVTLRVVKKALADPKVSLQICSPLTAPSLGWSPAWSCAAAAAAAAA